MKRKGTTNGGEEILLVEVNHGTSFTLRAYILYALKAYKNTF